MPSSLPFIESKHGNRGWMSFLKSPFGGWMIWPFSSYFQQLLVTKSFFSGRAMESDHDIDGPQPLDEGALGRTASQEGLDSREPSMMPGDLEPNVISVADLRELSMMLGNQREPSMMPGGLEPNIISVADPREPSMMPGDLEPNIISVADPREPSMMPGDFEPNIISVADPRDPSSSSCFSMKSGLPKNAFPGSRADCNVVEWLRDREDNGIMPLATLDVPGLRTPTYVRDEIRLLIKSLIQFIQYLHNQGRCISGGGGRTLRLENIHVVGQNLKFDVLELSNFTEELQDEDYKSVCCMITTTIIKEDTDLLPYDMQHLLKLLMNPRPHLYLISKHVALMNSIACRDFILLLWDKKKTMTQVVYKKWQNSIRDLNVGMYCWADHIHQDSPLLKVYRGGKYDKTSKLDVYQGGKCLNVSQLTAYRGGKCFNVSQLIQPSAYRGGKCFNVSQLIQPSAYRGGKCFNVSQLIQPSAYEGAKYPNTSKLNVYQGAEYDNTSKLHLIRFFRNAAAHLSDHSCRGERFHFEHISLIITGSFPTILPDLQERLHHHGILQEFL